VPVALLFLAVLEDHGDTKHKDHVDANNTKGGGEYSVQVPVGKRGKLANAAALLGGDQGV